MATTSMRAGQLIDDGWVANVDQVASVTESVIADGSAAGCRALDVRVAGGISLRLLPDRGLDLGAAWFAGLPLAWISPVGECRPLDAPEGTRWNERFGGGLLATCGLRNVGAPSEGHPQHGCYAHQPAGGVHARRRRDGDDVAIDVGATVEEVDALRYHLGVERTVTTWTGRGRIDLVDITTNLGDAPEATPLLYHVNLGAPLWGPGSRLELDSAEVLPRDDDARAGLDEWMRAPRPVPGAPEQVFEHRLAPSDDGWFRVRVISPAAGMTMTLAWEGAGLPRLHQWRHPGRAVLGLEPANCSVLGRGADREAGTLPVMQPGEARTSRLRIEVDQ